MSDILKHVVYSGNIQKSSTERKRLKQLKADFLRKHKVANHKLNLTNKQISNTFATKTTITK